MSETSAETSGDTPRRAPYRTTDVQRRRNVITLLVILGLLGAMIATAIILPNLNPR